MERIDPRFLVKDTTGQCKERINRDSWLTIPGLSTVPPRHFCNLIPVESIGYTCRIQLHSYLRVTCFVRMKVFFIPSQWLASIVYLRSQLLLELYLRLDFTRQRHASYSCKSRTQCLDDNKYLRMMEDSLPNTLQLMEPAIYVDLSLMFRNPESRIDLRPR